MARVTLTSEAHEDLADLDGAAKKVVLKAINKLKEDPAKRGEPLGSKGPGNLTTFRKLVVGNRTYRIVYQVADNGDVAVIWVIGKRADAEAYQMALARLKLHPDRRVADDLTALLEDVAEATGLELP